MFRFTIKNNNEHYFNVECKNEHYFNVISLTATMFLSMGADSVILYKPNVVNGKTKVLGRVSYNNKVDFSTTLYTSGLVRSKIDEYIKSGGSLNINTLVKSDMHCNPYSISSKVNRTIIGKSILAANNSLQDVTMGHKNLTWFDGKLDNLPDMLKDWAGLDMIVLVKASLEDDFSFNTLNSDVFTKALLGLVCKTDYILHTTECIDARTNINSASNYNHLVYSTTIGKKCTMHTSDNLGAVMGRKNLTWFDGKLDNLPDMLKDWAGTGMIVIAKTSLENKDTLEASNNNNYVNLRCHCDNTFISTINMLESNINIYKTLNLSLFEDTQLIDLNESLFEFCYIRLASSWRDVSIIYDKWEDVSQLPSWDFGFGILGKGSDDE